jgi:hypothetical protein
MDADQEISLTLLVSNCLGAYGARLATMEPAIDETIRVVSRQKEDQPENPSIPIMMNLLVAAKDLIQAHKVIERVADLMMTGGMQQEGPASVQ